MKRKRRSFRVTRYASLLFGLRAIRRTHNCARAHTHRRVVWHLSVQPWLCSNPRCKEEEGEGREGGWRGKGEKKEKEKGEEKAFIFLRTTSRSHTHAYTGEDPVTKSTVTCAYLTKAETVRYTAHLLVVLCYISCYLYTHLLCQIRNNGGARMQHFYSSVYTGKESRLQNLQNATVML